MSIHHLSLAFESASPFSKCFLRALSQMDILIKPNGFWKHPIWPLRAPEDYYEIHGKICMSCVGKCCDWAGGLNFEVFRGLFTEQSVKRGGLLLIVTLQIHVTQLTVGYYWTVLHLVFWFLRFSLPFKALPPVFLHAYHRLVLFSNMISFTFSPHLYVYKSK